MACGPVRTFTKVLYHRDEVGHILHSLEVKIYYPYLKIFHYLCKRFEQQK